MRTIEMREYQRKYYKKNIGQMVLSEHRHEAKNKKIRAEEWEIFVKKYKVSEETLAKYAGGKNA